MMHLKPPAGERHRRGIGWTTWRWRSHLLDDTGALDQAAKRTAGDMVVDIDRTAEDDEQSCDKQGTAQDIIEHILSWLRRLW